MVDNLTMLAAKSIAAHAPIASIASVPVVTAIATVAAIELAVAAVTATPALEITAGTVAIVTITIMPIVALMAIVPLFVPLLGFVPSDVGLGLICAHHAAHIDTAHLVVAIIAQIVGIAEFTGPRLTAECGGIAATLLYLLFAEGHDDAVVMLGMLQIAFREHRITRRLRIACKRDVLLRDMRGCTADLYVRAITLKATSQRILALAIASATTAVLLSLPHGLPFSIIVVKSFSSQPAVFRIGPARLALVR